MNAQNPCPTMNQRHWRRRHSHTKALKQFLESRENPNSVEHLQQKQSNRESAEPSWQLWLKTLCYLIINCNNFLNCFLLPALGGECTLPGAWAPGRAQQIEIYRTRLHFSKTLVHFADLGPIQSFATKFSWTSRFQNHNLQGLVSIWAAFHQDLTTRPRDIQDFAK